MALTWLIMTLLFHTDHVFDLINLLTLSNTRDRKDSIQTCHILEPWGENRGFLSGKYVNEDGPHAGSNPRLLFHLHLICDVPK